MALHLTQSLIHVCLVALAKFIEEKLKNLGLEIITPRESAIVFGMNEKEGDAILKEGEETRFKQIGLRIGTRKTQAIRSP